ncbi:MAG: hypothetical protein GX811_13470 [Lentisphaerae bacterium]|nr:hypothetical protein [Lentisphaerota bacterium]
MVPTNDTSFWVSIVSVVSLAIWLYLSMPHRIERGHRSPLSVPVKFVLITLVVTGLVIMKGLLRGFMTSFPMVGVVAVYEARYSLWTLGRLAPVVMLGLSALISIAKLLQDMIGLKPALLIGWIAYLIVLAALGRIPKNKRASEPA